MEILNLRSAVSTWFYCEKMAGVFALALLVHTTKRFKNHPLQGKNLLNGTKRASPYRAVNTPHLGYKNQSVSAV